MSEQPKPYLWVEPNPAGLSRQLMTVNEFIEFLRDWPSYAASGEGIELELTWLTDAEVEAIPGV